MDGNNYVLESINEVNKAKNNAKEILSSLLKEMLDHKLNKLEKKHVEESNSLKIMSKISQNIIITLDHYSHKVRKEIYKLRHKNDERHKKKREHESYRKNELNKTMYKDDKNNKNILDNNIDLLINKDNKSVLDTSNQSKSKRPSKSIDPKKYKSFFSEISNKEKNGKKEKIDVFQRLASKSIGNFKKLKLNMNGPLINNNTFISKSKSKKLNSSSKNLNNIHNKKSETEKNVEHSPSNKDSSNNKINSKIVSTPKIKQKQLKKIAQITIENSTNLINNTMIPEAAKMKLKKTNSKGKIGRRLSKAMTKKEDENKYNANKIIEKKKSKIEIEPEITEKDNENKITELKITNNIIINSKDIDDTNKLFPSKNEVKRSVKEKLLMDDEMLKNVNKDELLVSEINDEEKINEITEISAINLDDINIKESININTNLDNLDNLNNNNDLKKKTSVEFNSSVNSFNNNTPVNNIKTIPSKNNNETNKNTNSNINQNQNNTSENNNVSKSSNNINNIILSNPKNNPVNFLDNDNEINFTLVEDSPMDENDNDLNKTIDLNISGLSDQLSLQEKFETHLDEISRYLDMKDLCNLMLINKECFTTIMNVLISKLEITIDILEEEINKLKESNKDIDFNKISIEPFKLSSNSTRAISLLNNSSDCNLIKFEKNNNSINKEIFIVFGIFFIAAGKKKEYLRLNNEEEKIKFIYNYFKKDIEKMSLGSLIEKEINGKVFEDDIIASLFRYSNKYINIISPSRFQKTNKDVAIFVFVVKNILEHIGILDQQNIKPNKEYILYNARLKNNKMVLEELNNFFDKIN